MAGKYTEEFLVLPEIFTPGRIGVVTVLYDSASVLDDFFTSIERQTYSEFSVYCVDNASTDNSVALCRSRSERYVVIENGKNLGVAAGNNVGTRSAISDGCELVLYLNNDVVFGPDLFQQLVDGLNRHGCSMAAPIMYYHDRSNVIWAAGGHFQSWLGDRCQHYGDGDVDEGQYATSMQVAYTPTCCVLVRREIFSTIGMMDERYFVYYDDTDFMLRAYRAGKSLYILPHAKLWHKVSSLVGTDSPFRTRFVHRNHALFGHKNLSAPFACLISIVYCAGYLALSLCGRISFSQARDRIRFWMEGIRVARLSRVD
ncbi:MAG TPA: glycosyltransferase family 2 protein [Acidobacteriaceae bacterium]|nr:glycosyltransferase family 2 protein [Acidobacteriaceae bacterium]